MKNKVQFTHLETELSLYMEIQIIMFHQMIQVILNWHGINIQMVK
jgi:hypothetical protein